MEKKKRTGKTIRQFVAFLAAVCMLSTMPGIPAVSYAEESFEESLETYGAGADGQEGNLEDLDVKEQTDDPVREAGEAAKEEENLEDMAESENMEDAGENDAEILEDQENTGEDDTEKPAGREDAEQDDAEESAGREDAGDDGAEESQDQENDVENGETNGDFKPDETEGSENPEEGTLEDGEAPKEDVEEEPEEIETDKDAFETVSENAIQTDKEDAAVSVSNVEEPPQQPRSSGKIFEVDGETYNSEDADQTFVAGDDITAYYFESDSLLYFDGTGPMKDWYIVVNRPWYHIYPERCVIGEGITYVGAYDFYWPTHSPKSVSLPGTLEVIGECAFNQCSGMEEVLLPDGLTSIGKSAFSGCNSLTSIDIPGSVTDLGECAFYECRSLVSVHVPGSVKEIKKAAFSFCKSITTLTIDEGVESIGMTAFQECKISELSLPESVKTIGDYAFNQATAMHTLTIPDSVTEIGERAFNYCNNLLNIHIGTGVTTIGENAFQTRVEKKFRLFSENETVWAYDWTGDRRVIAYQITFMDTDGSPLKSDFVGMGEKVLPYAPEMEGYSTKEETFIFTGWEPEITEETEVAADVEYTPLYQSVPRTYHVIFKDFDEMLIADLELAYGMDIYEEQPDAPKREPDAQYSYTFSGWTPALLEGTKVGGETEYTASYTSEKRQYTITFLDYDGSILKKVKKPYGTVIADEAPTPVRESDGEHTYEFEGWQPALDAEDILTADAAYEAVYASDRKECKVVFRDYDGSVLKTCTVPYGETVSGQIPEASRENEGLSSYTFVGWEPALDTDAPIFGDITYTALYTRKTQAGIYVEHGINHPSGSGISAADITVYPVYEFYDTKGQLQKEVTDREHPVSKSDIRLSPDKVEKGDNEISVEQVSTGCTSDISVYGSFIDGISAVPVEGEVKTGSVVEKANVYFTRNQKREDGEIQQGVVQETEAVARYILNDDTAPVIVAEGDNSIKITEKETGEEYFCIIHVTGVGKGSSDDTEDDSGDDDDKKDDDGDDGKEPDDGDDGEKPDDDGKKPDDGDGDKGKKPGDGDGDGEPDGGDGEPDEESGGDGDGGGQPDAELTGDSEKTPESIPEIPAQIILSQGAKPQAVQGKKPVFSVPEIPDESIQPEEKSEQTKKPQQQETVPEEKSEAVKERWHMPFWMWIMLLVGAGAGILSVLLGFLFEDKKVVCGTVFDKDGKALRGMKVTLAGQEEETMETQTDKNGQFMFDGLDKDDYRLCLFGRDASSLLLLDIRMGSRGNKKLFAVLKDSVGSVEKKRSGRKYQIDIMV